MKSNYQISVFRRDGELVTLGAYCSRLQAERAFYALCFMLNQKPYKRISLSIVSPFGLEPITSCEVTNG